MVPPRDCAGAEYWRVNAREGRGRLIQAATYEPPDINMNNSSEILMEAVILIRELVLFKISFEHTPRRVR